MSPLQLLSFRTLSRYQHWLRRRLEPSGIECFDFTHIRRIPGGGAGGYWMRRGGVVLHAALEAKTTPRVTVDSIGCIAQLVITFGQPTRRGARSPSIMVCQLAGV